MKGKILSGRYEILDKIGGGGMAIVYKAKCNLLNRYVAVKILRPEFTTDKDLVENFKRESQAAASLSHPNIVNLYDVGEDDGVYYIVMEYIDGNTLKHYIKEHGPLDLEVILDYATQIAFGLQHAHDNHVIHRDIKPHNILITKDNRAKVTDFGIAIAATSSTLTNVGSVIGSVHYFSPEQARGGYTDEKSDLYSLGIVMYEMSTGRLPFEAENPLSVALKQTQEVPVPPRQLNENIPKGLENIILKLMQKEQSKRYQNARSLIEDLNRLKNDSKSQLVYDDEEEEIDSPTQVLPAVKDEDMKKAKKSNPSKKKSKNKKIIIGAVFAALLAALLFTFAIFNVMDFFGRNEVEVPDFENMQIEEARQLATEINLKLNEDTQHSTEVDANRIISQDITPGMLVKEGYPVKVVVSLGNRMIPVPNILYRNEADAVLLLENGGFRKGHTRLAHSEFPEGQIIEQNPQPSTPTPAGSTVDFVISQGPEIITNRVPFLIGLSIEEGTNALSQAGIGISRITREHSNEFEEGLIISQSIEPLTEIPATQTIELVVSRGKINNNQGDPNGEPEQGPGQETSATPLTSRQLSIDLRGYNGSVNVEIIRISTGDIIDSRKYNIQTQGSIYSKTLQAPAGSGTESFQVFVNGNRHGDPIQLVF